MLSEEALQALPEPLWKTFQQLEINIITTICTHIGSIGELTATDIHKLDELQRIGFNLAEIQADIAKTVNKSEKQIYDIFYKASEIEYNGQKANYDLTGIKFIPFAENKQLQELVQNISRATFVQFVNISSTSGFVNARNAKGVIVQGGIWQPLDKYYQSVIDYGIIQVRTGQTDFHSAMRSTIKQMTDNGLTFIEYNLDNKPVYFEINEKGKKKFYYANEEGKREYIEFDPTGKRYYKRRLDSSVRSGMLGGQARLSHAQSEIIGEEIGADGMEITYHSNPRPSHVWIGGIQVNMKRYFNDVLPLMGEPNCYHRSYPIVLNISTSTYTKKELNELNSKDAEPREWQGKKLTGYETTQIQREYELRIRQQKDRAVAFRFSQDTEGEQQARGKMKAIQTEYKQFSESVELSIKLNRIQVAGY